MTSMTSDASHCVNSTLVWLEVIKKIEAILKVSKMNRKLHKWTVQDGRGYGHKYNWTPYSSHEDNKDDEEDDKYTEYFDN